MQAVLDEVLAGAANKITNENRMTTIQPRDLRNQQLANISEMIREKKRATQQLASTPLSPKQHSVSSASQFNTKRNETRDLVKAIN